MIRRSTVALVFLLAAGMLLSGCSFMDGGQPQARDDSPSSPTPSSSAEESATDTTTQTPEPEKSGKPGKSPEGDESPEPSKSASPDPSVDLSEPPSSYAEAAAHVNAAERSGSAQQVKRFESPDANYYCVFSHRYVRPSCEMSDRSIRDEDLCAGGMSPYMGRIELTGGGWRPFCNSDTVREPGATKLQVGSVAAWSDQGITCVLERIGLTCISKGRQGFFLGSGRYDVF